MAGTRWGLLSAGQIAHDFAATLKYHPPQEHEVVAVAARSLEKAREFGQKFSIPKCYGSYKELFQDPNVDIIYISTVHPFHYENCLLALHAGKHVLCEKPVCMNVKQTTDVLNLAKEKKLFFMEGFWNRFFPLYKVVRDEVEGGVIGDIRMITVDCGLDFSEKERNIDNKLGGGALLDLGCYNVSFINMLMKGKPEKVVASGYVTDVGVDLWSSAILHYSGNMSAILTCHQGAKLSATAKVFGLKGQMELPEFWAPRSITTPTGNHTEAFPELTQYKKLIFPYSEGLIYEQRHVRECLLKGLTESPIMPHEDSLDIMGILDEIRRQIGVTYDADK